MLQEDGTRRDLASVFIPSNHLYLGAIHIVDRVRIVRTVMTLQEGATLPFPPALRSKGISERPALRTFFHKGGIHA